MPRSSSPTQDEENGTEGPEVSGEEESAEGEESPGGDSQNPAREADPCEEVTEISCWFTTGQEADLLLGRIDFNNTGGPLLFDHPLGIASDGQRLVLLDSNNNRALIWNSLPQENTEPDLVLGQEDFTTNNSGEGLDGLNWPSAAVIAGERLVIADAENDRILIWNRFPTESGQPADLVLRSGDRGGGAVSQDVAILWPWGVWTDGQKLVVSSTLGGRILFWNSFPTQNDQPADFVIKIQGEIGTPRGIASDGTALVIGDHNAFGSGHKTFVWKTFPTTENQRYDFVLDDSGPPLIHQGRLLIVGNQLAIWDSLPESASDNPDLSVGARSQEDSDGFFFGSVGGEGQSITSAGESIYIAAKNRNNVIGYSSLPTSVAELPDLVVGAPDLETNTLETNYFITNPVPATDGESLFVSSDYDLKLYIWREIPERSGTPPDIVLEGVAHWDNHLFGGRFAGTNRTVVDLWEELPRNGEPPSRVFEGSIGSVTFQDLRGIAFNDRYFFLSDYGAGRVTVWEGFPEEDSEPLFSLEIPSTWRLAADEDYLIVTSFEGGGALYIYPLENFSEETEPTVIEGGGDGFFNGASGAMVKDGHLAVADVGWGRVLLWTDIADAMTGNEPDVILGATGLEDKYQETGKSTLFWPAALAFDGLHLWVGETKFSGRLVRFTMQPTGPPAQGLGSSDR